MSPREREREREQSNSNTDPIEITCSFEIKKNTKIQLDTDAKTTLAEEQLLDKDGRLTFTKQFFINNDQCKTYITVDKALTVKGEFLLTFTSDHLIKLCDRMEIKHTQTCSTPELRQLIREKGNFEKQSSRNRIYTNLKTSDGKPIEEKLKALLPRYCLLKDNNIAYTDNNLASEFIELIHNSLMQNETINKVLTQTKRAIQSTLRNLSKRVNKQFKNVLPNHTNKTFTLKINPDLKNKEMILSLFNYKFHDQHEIPISQYGCGFNRLLLFTLLQIISEAKTQTIKTSKNNVIYAIEEPETAQHPDWQSHLLKSIRELSQTDNHQILFTTHTREIVNILNEEQVAWIKNGKCNKLKGNIKEFTNDMGMLPVCTRGIIVVEGETDRTFYQTLNKISDFKAILDLSNISLAVLNGKDNAKKPNALITTLANEYNIPIFTILDSDQGKNDEPPEFGKSIKTKKREIENYFSKEFYRNFTEQYEYFKRSNNEPISNWNNADIMKDVLKVTNKEKEKNCKSAVQSYFQTLVGEETTLADLEKKFKIFSDGAVEDIKRILMEAKDYLSQKQETTSSATEEPTKTEDPTK